MDGAVKYKTSHGSYESLEKDYILVHLLWLEKKSADTMYYDGDVELPID